MRSCLFWLNKGVSALYVYNSFDGDDDRFGVLQHDGEVSPAMRALHRLVSRLSSAGPRPGSPTAIDMSVEQLTGQRGYYANDPDGRRKLFAAFDLDAKAGVADGDAMLLAVRHGNEK